MHHEYLHSEVADKPLSTLQHIFHPQSIAIIGAKEASPSVGRTVCLNLLEGGFEGSVFLVNPKHDTLFSRPCYHAIGDIEEHVDLAVIAVPAAQVPQVVRECASCGVHGAVIISAGFKESGEAGKALEKEIVEIAATTGIRLLGPNCLGFLVPSRHINASFARNMPKEGSIAFISQSGALCTAVLDWSRKENVGFSSFVSVGSMADIDWGDLIKYFGQDPNTHSILMYVETLGDAKNFFSKARRVAAKKPIIVIKPGKSDEAKKAAGSHTGALSASDAVFDAACERVGILRVNTIEDLFSVAELLSTQPIPKGPRLAIITNAGGPSVLATDSAVLEGATLAPLDTKTIQELSSFLPAASNIHNPIDLLGDASPERYKRAAQAVLSDPNVAGILFILTPQDMTDPLKTAEEVLSVAKNSNKTILASWMGEESVAEARALLTEGKIPSFLYPDEAAKAFSLMWKYARFIKTVYETPQNEISSLEEEVLAQQKTHETLSCFMKENKMLLSESESKQVLKEWGFPVLESFKAVSKEEAVEKADQLGYPVVLKLESHEVIHKALMGGVKLSLKSAAEVSAAFDSIYESTLSLYSQEAFEGVSVQKMVSHSGLELIVGSAADPQFGPTILFGAGGHLVEVFQDVSLGIPPINSVFARQMIAHTKVGKKLENTGAFIELLARFSDFIGAHPEIKECDLNPIVSTKSGALILDARILLHQEMPVPAILRPYPLNFMVRKRANDGTELLFRSIRSEDEAISIVFHEGLSEKMALLAYLRPRPLEERASHERMSRICFADPDKDILIIGEYEKEGKKCVAGAIRLSRLPWTEVWDLMWIVHDPFHTLEIGEMYFAVAMKIAQSEGISTISASAFADDELRNTLLQKFGFSIYRKDGNVLKYMRLV